MVANIRRAVAQVKDDLPCWIESWLAQEQANEQPMTKRRRRKLDRLTTLLLFLTQVLHGNTAISHLRHLAGMDATPTAYCKARRRLPLALVQRLSERLARRLQREHEAEADLRWRGHRVYLGDGSGFSTPDTPELQQHFGQHGQQRPGCGFPVAMMLMLTSAAGFITQTLARPHRTHEASQLASLYQTLAPGDVLVYDRAACSYAHFALLVQHQLHGIIRAHQRRIVSFRARRRHARQLPKGQRRGTPRSRWLGRLGPTDQLVNWFKPDRRPDWMTAEQYAALPAALTLRELQYRVQRKGFRTRSVTLVTTLVNPLDAPAEELAEQYQRRWRIETDLGHLKQTMGMDVLKCKSVEGVLKELAMFTLAYNLVRAAIVQAAGRQGVPLDRISFVDALRWLRQAGEAGQGWIALLVNPRRPDRLEPRVVKRRPKSYRLMTRPREDLRQAMTRQTLAA